MLNDKPALYELVTRDLSDGQLVDAKKDLFTIAIITDSNEGFS